jgi:hypothetical protein
MKDFAVAFIAAACLIALTIWTVRIVLIFFGV